jgi:hypothetical protein
VRGFINYDFIDLFPDFLQEVGHGVLNSSVFLLIGGHRTFAAERESYRNGHQCR